MRADSRVAYQLIGGMKGDCAVDASLPVRVSRSSQSDRREIGVIRDSPLEGSKAWQRPLSALWLEVPVYMYIKCDPIASELD